LKFGGRAKSVTASRTERGTGVRNLGPTEIFLILAVVVLLFGAKKLPELARGSGRALRIFKAETKGLVDDDDETTEPKAITPAETTVTEVKPAAPIDLGAVEHERRPGSTD
jgi:sec-independent protein translocase protein TatA